MSNTKEPQWHHPGGKLRELGAESLTNEELLAILISTGTKGKSAEDIAKEILEKFGGFKGIANQPLEKFLKFDGIGDVKITRIAAAFEMARRMTIEVLEEWEKQKLTKKDLEKYQEQKANEMSRRSKEYAKQKVKNTP